MKKIAIIDDNKAARSALRKIIDFNFKNIFEIKEANSVLSGHQLISDFQPDIVMLDVEMGDGTGLDLVNLLTKVDFKLIFVTAHKNYALEAIKHRPYAYLLKPINPFEFVKTINTLLSENIETTSVDKIAIKNQDNIVLVDVADIIYCKADGSYTEVITNKKQHLSSKNLKHFESILKESNFLRVHNSHLINANYIESFNRHKQTGLTLKNGEKIPVSSRKIKIISEYLESLS